jgi:hypothetical protein
MIAAILTVCFGLLCLGALRSSAITATLVVTLFSLEQCLQGYVPFLRSGPGLEMVNYIIGLTTVAGAFSAIMRDPMALRESCSPTWLASISLFAWAAFTIIWTPSQSDAVGLLRWGIPYFGINVFLGPILVRTYEDLDRLWAWLILVGCVISAGVLLSPEFSMYNGRYTLNLSTGDRSAPLALGELGGFLMIASVLFRGRMLPGMPATVTLLVRIAGFILGTVVAIKSGSRGQFFFAVGILLALFPVAAPVRSVRVMLTSMVGILLAMVAVQFIFSSLLEGLSRTEADRFSLDEILYGGSSASGRFANLITLATAWAQRPQAWLAGLGYNAFTSFSLSGEPYSHVLFADAIFELGPIGAVLLGTSLTLGFRSIAHLIRMSRGNAAARPGVTILFAFLLYQIILVNKQGSLWAVPIIFLFLPMATAVERHEEALSDPMTDTPSEDAEGQPMRPGEPGPSM